MRILLPVHAFTDTPRSGLHTAIWNIARTLGERGHEVHVISTYARLTGETISSLRQKNIYLHRAGQFNMHNLNGALALRCFLTALRLRLTMRFDWIFVIDTSVTPFHRFKLGARLATRALTPSSPEFLQFFSSGDWQYDRVRKDAEEGWEGRAKPLWFRIFTILSSLLYPILGIRHHTENVDLLFCQNSDVLNEWNKIPGVHAVLLPNGVETAPLEKKEPVPIHTNRFVFLYVGHIGRRFGLFRLLPVFETFLQKRQDVELWIIGKGSKELTAEAEAYAKRNPERIRLLGEIPKEDIGPYYHASSALLNPAFYHGFSSAVAEAMYCAKPVIAPLRGGSKDLITPGTEGFLMGPDTPVELEEKMAWLCDHTHEAKAMGAKAKARIENGFLWEQVARRMEEAFLSHA